MSMYDVLLAVGNGRRLDTGRRFKITVLARGPLDAAVIAEQNTDPALGENEFSYAKRVSQAGGRLPAAMALAA